MVTGNPSIARNTPIEVLALHGQQFLERGAAVFLVVGENHGPHVRNLSSPKNMCSVRHRPMPSAPNARA